MEAMDADCYVIEYAIRNRLIEARARARSGANHETLAAGALGKEGLMTYSIKPLSCEPTKLRGLSEKLIVSHWENNYGGAVRRLNAIRAQLAELDFSRAPIFVLNGLKREELIATNSMTCTSCTST